MTTSASNQSGQSPYATQRSSYLLPGDASTWEKCRLGPLEQWPAELEGYSATIAALVYPAAVFYDDDLLLFHNQAWHNGQDLGAQGQPHAERLSSDTVGVVRSVIARGIPKEIQEHDFLKAHGTLDNQPSTAIISPLLPPHNGSSKAALVQLLPKPMLYRSLECGTGESGSGTNRGGDDTTKAMERSLENAPLDEHPFFRRFAEMLPSGLAILDHNARAVFVNQYGLNYVMHLSHLLTL